MLLHSGVGHPSLVWILASAFVAFAVGTTIGALFLDRRGDEATSPATSADEPSES